MNSLFAALIIVVRGGYSGGRLRRGTQSSVIVDRFQLICITATARFPEIPT